MEQFESLIFLVDLLFFTQGIIFGSIFIFTSKKERPTLFLGLFLFSFVLGALPSVLDVLFEREVFDYELIPQAFLFLMLPLFYIYAHKVSVIKEQKWDYRILIPGVLEVVLWVIFISIGFNFQETIFGDIYGLGGFIFNVFVAIKIIQFANKHLSIVKNQYASISGLQLFWVKRFAFGLLANLFLIVFTSFFDTTITVFLLYTFQLILIYWLIYKGIRQENVEPLLDQEDEDFIVKQVSDVSNPKVIKLGDETELQDIIKSLDEHLKISKAYKRKDLSIVDVSNAIEMSPKKVSKAINHIKSVNFNSYINGFRIEEAVFYLQNPDFEYLSIEGIGNEAGFKSKSAFYNAFKKEKDCTPLELRKQS